MTSKELLKEIESWLSFNTEPSREETAKLRKSIKDHLAEQLHIQNVSYCDASSEDIADNYYTAECSKCGWWGSSKLLDGGGAIADTGDYFDCTCPVCGNYDIDERHGSSNTVLSDSTPSQGCYKSGEPCKYNCSGLCKESC